MNTAKVRILLVDDHPLLRASVRGCLGKHSAHFDVIAEAENADEAWQAVVQHEPDLVVMDVWIPGEDGIALTKRIHAAFPRILIIILTAHTEGQKINSALDAGAAGFVLKSCSGEELATAVDAVMAGQIYLSPAASTAIVKERQRSGDSEGVLTAKEFETLRQIANGLTTKEIAYAMQVSPKTVETHRLNLMSKLKINTVAGLTKYAIRHGFTSL